MPCKARLGEDGPCADDDPLGVPHVTFAYGVLSVLCSLTGHSAAAGMDGAAGRQASGSGPALGGGFGSGLLQAAAEQQMQVQKRAHLHQQGVWSAGAGAVADPNALLPSDAIAQVRTTAQCTSSMCTFAVHVRKACTQQVPCQTFRRLWIRSEAAAWIRGASGRLLCPGGSRCHRSVESTAARICRVCHHGRSLGPGPSCLWTDLPGKELPAKVQLTWCTLWMPIRC